MKKIGVLGATVLICLLPYSAIASQYDGKWSFKINTTVGVGCAASSGDITVSDGKFLGTIKSEGLKLRVRGKVSDSGEVKGRVGVGLARLKGQLSSASYGAGTWKNRFGCKGTFKLQKIG